ncbi:hypothetical protein OESDEN_15874 [Oesophagostomum dentatum]|uniref:Uncharacterized protein n=1 Tax=Oesophagostomum dentatum TaxID=61180 RepID=A0A0B1SLJ8_OESDE|nr:hypothetical protein OESDEN_15874 [Oesophagostomum dentatum]
MGPCEFKTSLERVPKRRLYFSSEYLDEAMMANPPPVAEQFLTDLRRVIEIARERIRMRRFVPMLITIPEDHEENRNSVVQEIESEPAEQQTTSQQDSPKSDKSVDSGRESPSESDDSSREDDEEAQQRANNEAHEVERVNSVRNIVNGFESRTAPATHPPKPSRIPPRIPAKPRLPTSQIPTLLGESSPRPLQKSLALARAPSLPKSSPPRITPDSRQVFLTKSES